VGFLERDFERNHLAEKSNRTKMGQKIHCALAEINVMGVDTFVSWKYWNHLRWLQEKKPDGHIKCRAIARAGQGTTKGLQLK
jgi:hypothetical protein